MCSSVLRFAQHTAAAAAARAVERLQPRLPTISRATYNTLHCTPQLHIVTRDRQTHHFRWNFKVFLLLLLRFVFSSFQLVVNQLNTRFVEWPITWNWKLPPRPRTFFSWYLYRRRLQCLIITHVGTVQQSRIHAHMGGKRSNTRSIFAISTTNI